MAFTKIQPQQIQLPIFSSHSGDMTFNNLITGVNAVLNRTLDGDFNFLGSLSVSSSKVLVSNSTNNSSTGSLALGGQGNTVTGSNNVILNGLNNTDVSGSFNVIVNGEEIDFGASGQNNTVLAGYQSTFGDQTTGAVILADHSSTVTNEINHSLSIDFESGVMIDGGGAYFNTDLNVNASSDATFSGDLNVSGVSTFDDVSIFNGVSSFNDTTIQNGHFKLAVGNSGIFSGNCLFNNQVQFADSAEFGAPSRFNSNLTLSDSSEAASQDWVGLSITESENSTLTTALEGGDYNLGSVADLENVLTGTAAGSDIFTGHVLTGLDGTTPEAYFVLQGANFTGALQFSDGFFRAI